MKFLWEETVGLRMFEMVILQEHRLLDLLRETLSDSR